MEEKKKGSWKKKTAVGVVAAAASASVLVGSAFDSPADVLNPAGDEDAPAPLVETVALNAAPAADDGDSADDGEARRHRFPNLRRWVQSMPMTVRALVALPMWCVSWGITELLSLLWQAAMTPLGSKILSWVLAALAVVLVYALTAKALFPNAPWKKILRKRNVVILLVGMAILGTADTVLGVFWKEYPPIGRLLRLIGGALLLTCAWLASRRLMRRSEKAAAPIEEPSPRTDVEKQAMALADTVCPPSVPRP